MKKISLITGITLLATCAHFNELGHYSVAEIIGLIYGTFFLTAILVYGIKEISERIFE